MSTLKTVSVPRIPYIPGYDLLRSCYHSLGFGDRGASNSALKAWYGPFVAKGSIVFDIGANRGDHTDAFLSLGASVISIEPNSKCCGVLRRRFLFRKVTIERCALGAAPGSAQLQIGANDTLGTLSTDWVNRRTSKGRFVRDGDFHSEVVPVRTFDELVLAHGFPEFVKIDVEGFELEVFRGMSRMPAALCFEFNGEAIDIAIDAVSRLVDLGANSFCIRMGRGSDSGPVDWVPPEQLIDSLNTFEKMLDPVFGDIFAR